MTTGVEHAARLASELYLVPENVMHLVSYWVAQYTNYEKSHDEREYFNDLVDGLLRCEPRLYFAQSPTTNQDAHNMLSTPGVIQIAGRETHRLPLEQLARGFMERFFESLVFVQDPVNECFRSYNDDNLGGELEYADFVYDPILVHMIEPSFLVIAAYAIHLPSLYHTTGRENDSDWLARHLYSLNAINTDVRESLSYSDRDKLARTRHDMEQLYTVLSGTDFDKMMSALMSLLEQKATYCYNDIVPRVNKLPQFA